jgi:hypothetical protein
MCASMTQQERELAGAQIDRIDNAVESVERMFSWIFCSQVTLLSMFKQGLKEKCVLPLSR